MRAWVCACLRACAPYQVSNNFGGEESYQERMEEQLVPCLSQLAVAAGRDSLWKLLNYQLLLKTRETSPQVRERERERERKRERETGKEGGREGDHNYL